jgi:hypothetical protein
MWIYHYATIEKPEMIQAVETRADITMENADYKRQPDVAAINHQVVTCNGYVCGIFRGGMFGLKTNQIAIFSAWDSSSRATDCYSTIAQMPDTIVAEQFDMTVTVRPSEPTKIDREGFYVIRWIRMLSTDVDEYTRLCLETWPAFESFGTARCYGVFSRAEEGDVSKVLMLTWYASMDDWEKSRNLAPVDSAKWSRRSEMELSHWAEGARLVMGIQ